MRFSSRSPVGRVDDHDVAVLRLGQPVAYPQHPRSACTGGQGTSPYEQNTQQSPGLGLSSAPQAGQSWKNRQASVGMVSTDRCPHCGHVSVLCRHGSRMGSGRGRDRFAADGV